MTKTRKGPIIFSKSKPFSGLKNAIDIGRSEVLDYVRKSNIKGRGGAGFPTGVKWNLTATASDKKKYVICNADEGEPGTFKDRVLLDEYAKLVFEGMVICAFAVGADEGILYLRGEYISFLPELEKTLNQMRKNNLLGKNILGKKGFNFDIKIRLGVGAYVCGEETSLIESLEGYRGEPRNKPPFPTNTGFAGHPTVINNVETFAAIAHIILKGPDWFRSIGTEKSSGSKLISVSGDCKKPGVYEIPFGTTIKKILKLTEAKDTKAVEVGGASGVCVAKSEFGRKIAYEDLSTGGSIIIFSKKRDLLEVAKNFLDFFAEESCGQCTPCREGIPVLQEKLDKLQQKKATKGDLEDIFSLAETMYLASKCGLGQTAASAFVSILSNFKKDYVLVKS
ncbi:MAG: dehydrogenase [Candidatus Omnitrophica bacterium]|nr:dehydrogenase [Candidatus Omnitrophota bacterium]MCF7893543.1 dehydrogenase [Candidatus Omnitrophota bacterium]